MKRFSQFIIEARETQASTEAKNRGWKSSGHGDYYDNAGKLVAKTIGGELKIDRKSTRLNSSHGYISYAVF